jgi:hypothetical protein
VPRFRVLSVLALVLLMGVSVAGCGERRHQAPAVSSGAQAPPPAAATFNAGPVDALLLSRSGLWYEGNWKDRTAACTLYSFRQGSGGVRYGTRVRYFPGLYTTGCRITEPTSPPSTFSWSTQGNQVTLQFATGYAEQLAIQGDAAQRIATISRPGGFSAVWVGCGHPSFPPVLAHGCV